MHKSNMHFSNIKEWVGGNVRLLWSLAVASLSACSGSSPQNMTNETAGVNAPEILATELSGGVNSEEFHSDNLAAPNWAGGEESASFDEQSSGRVYHDSLGDRYLSRSNEHGLVLMSANETIYLGEKCDAKSSEYGVGRWEWANGGFVVTFGNREVGFPRQETNVDNDGNCRS